jgi:hypothetical protein
VLEAAALEVGFEFLLNIRRQGRAPCRQMLLERREVFLNDLIEKGALRAAAHIQRHIHTVAGSLPAANGNLIASVRDSAGLRDTNSEKPM